MPVKAEFSGGLSFGGKAMATGGLRLCLFSCGLLLGADSHAGLGLSIDVTVA